MKVDSILSDKREISSVWSNDGQTGFEVGMLNVTKIEPYEETDNLWFAVYRGEFLYARVNGSKMAVIFY